MGIGSSMLGKRANKGNLPPHGSSELLHSLRVKLLVLCNGVQARFRYRIPSSCTPTRVGEMMLILGRPNRRIHECDQTDATR